MASKRKVWIIVTQEGDIGEGPWDDKQGAQEFLDNEVGVVAALLQVSEDSMVDIDRVSRLSANISYEPDKFRAHIGELRRPPDLGTSFPPLVENMIAKLLGPTASVGRIEKVGRALFSFLEHDGKHIGNLSKAELRSYLDDAIKYANK